jgi:hypothetical protein
MNYLERNALIVAEINQNITSEALTLRKTGKSSFGSSTEFFPVGQYESKILGVELYLGFKKSIPGRFLFFYNDLGIASAIATQIPELSPEVPVFIASVKNKRGQALGVLTEDFSKGGREEVKALHEALTDLLPVGIRTLNYLDDEELAKVAFLVGNEEKRRLGDFNTVLPGLSLRLREKLTQSDQILVREKDFTVSVDARRHLRK